MSFLYRNIENPESIFFSQPAQKPSKNKCTACLQEVQGEKIVLQNKFIIRGGFKPIKKLHIVTQQKVYMKECFKCNTCKVQLWHGKAYVQDNEIICHGCIEKCQCPCKRILGDQYIQLANGMKINKSCFSCQICKQQIQENYSEKNGRFTCVECLDKCSCGCGSPIQGRFFNLANGTKMNQGCLKCSTCREPIDEREYCEKGDFSYHLECLEKCACGCNKPIIGRYNEFEDGKKINLHCMKCEECQTQLGEDYYVLKDRMICPSCIKFKTQVCAGCYQPITNSYISTLGKCYMTECFKCFLCKRLIQTEQHGDFSGFPVCVDCNKKVPQNRTSQSTVPVVNAQFQQVSHEQAAIKKKSVVMNEPLDLKKSMDLGAKLREQKIDFKKSMEAPRMRQSQEITPIKVVSTQHLNLTNE